MSSLISIEELKVVTGYSNTSAVERFLTRNGIPFFYGKKGYIFTTREAMNRALGVSNKKVEDIETIEFD